VKLPTASGVLLGLCSVFAVHSAAQVLRFESSPFSGQIHCKPRRRVDSQVLP